MVSRMDVNPGANEIRAELSRVLTWERLSASPSQAALLEVIVHSHLSGEPTDEKSIGPKAFPGFVAGNSTDVRIHAHKLRKTLAEYYGTDGSHDPVIIEISKGRNYKVKASYNARSKALTSYKAALEVMSDVGSFPWMIIDALGHCLNAIEQDKDFAPAYGLYAEFALCYGITRRGELFKYGVAPYRGIYGEINVAREYALQSLKLNRNSWRGWVALGICYACRDRWQLAARAIAKALICAPADVPGDPWYLIYLVAIREDIQAFTIAKNKWYTSSPRSFWKALYFLIFYAVGTRGDFGEPFREEEAEVACGDTYLFEAIMAMKAIERRTDWLPHSVRAFDRMRERYVLDKYHTIGSLGLYALVNSANSDDSVAKGIAEDINKPDYYSLWGRIGSIPSIPLDHSILSGGFYIKAAQNGDRAKHDYIVNDWEMALVYLALGERKEAIHFLSMARTTQNPMALWLHLWPFLEPLWQEPDFIKLIRDMKLPDGVENRKVAKFFA
jgi:hypothetical protein